MPEEKTCGCSRRKGSSSSGGSKGSGSKSSGGGDSDCTEIVTAYALLQYIQLNGTGWSNPITTTVRHNTKMIRTDLL